MLPREETALFSSTLTYQPLAPLSSSKIGTSSPKAVLSPEKPSTTRVSLVEEGVNSIGNDDETKNLDLRAISASSSHQTPSGGIQETSSPGKFSTTRVSMLEESVIASRNDDEPKKLALRGISAFASYQTHSSGIPMTIPRVSSSATSAPSNSGPPDMLQNVSAPNSASTPRQAAISALHSRKIISINTKEGLEDSITAISHTNTSLFWSAPYNISVETISGPSEVSATKSSIASNSTESRATNAIGGAKRKNERKGRRQLFHRSASRRRSSLTKEENRAADFRKAVDKFHTRVALRQLFRKG